METVQIVSENRTFARVCESTNREVRQVMQGTESDFSDGVDDVQFVFAVNNSAVSYTHLRAHETG